jgi:2,3-bisphosphoglycerate-dependent phosphoglycerate mutase
MYHLLLALLLGLSIISTACTETVTETKTVSECDTVVLTVRDTITIPNIIVDTLTTVIVVRHAEKADNSADPVLSPDGEARARELARILEDVKINSIYTTPMNRTRLTVKHVGDSRFITAKDYATNVSAAQLAARIRMENAGKVALVVGHSNTVPELLKALSNNGFNVQIAEHQFDNLFIATLHAGVPQILHMKFGKPTP